ncbi:MAG: DUF2141 domain-containing protein [Bacteroidales bacterium]|nr:DUF2141 domain-containing protein [Bacteroidales bacterium]
MRTILLFAILTGWVIESHAQTRIQVDISPVKSLKGVVRIAVYSNPCQYPRNPFRTYNFKKDSVKNRVLHGVINDLPPGKYAFTLLDDKNESGDMDYNLLGIPTEGYGFGNNVRAFLKAPDYEKCVIRIRPGLNHINLIIRNAK